MVAGEEHVEVFTVLDAAGAAQDLTGAYCYLGIWRPSTNLQIFQRDNDPGQSNAGIVLTDAAGGIVTATVARANTSSTPSSSAIGAAIEKHSQLPHRSAATTTSVAELRGQVKELDRRGAKLDAVLTAIQSSISLIRQDLRELRRSLLRRRRTP